MKGKIKTIELPLEVPFSISRSTTRVHRICVLELECRGVTGYGEASPSAYYGDSLEGAKEALGACTRLIGDDPFAVEAAGRLMRERFPSSPSAGAAVEAALCDLGGKLAGLPVFRMLGLSGLKPPPTSYTVGVDDVDLARGRLEWLRRFPILKVKVGFGDEEALLDLLATGTDAVLRVDANEGWTLDEAVGKVDRYGREYGIELFEQPLPKEDIDGYRKLKAACSGTIIVDESVRRAEDIGAWAGVVDGINVKLMKCGGLREALEMIGVARSLGMRVMLGCMIESSLGISAAAQIAPLVDFCDLDGNLLIARDPFTGVKADQGELNLPEEPGLGVRPSA
jgi:L-alanine-DL-glutamate epimerase-like enolase superfamily enzyme